MMQIGDLPLDPPELYERCINCAKGVSGWSTIKGQLLCLRTLENVSPNQDACEYFEATMHIDVAPPRESLMGAGREEEMWNELLQSWP